MCVCDDILLPVFCLHKSSCRYSNYNSRRFMCRGQAKCLNQRHGQSLGEGMGWVSYWVREVKIRMSVSKLGCCLALAFVNDQNVQVECFRTSLCKQWQWELLAYKMFTNKSMVSEDHVEVMLMMTFSSQVYESNQCILDWLNSLWLMIWQIYKWSIALQLSRQYELLFWM
jgi:hypothetical protein